MTSPRSAVVAASALLVPALLLLAGCGAPADTGTSPTTSPTPSFSPSVPSPAATLPVDAGALAQWAASALPENAVGGSTAIARGTGTIDAAGARLDLAHEPGDWQVVLACESLTGAPLTVRIGGGAASEVPCAAPGGTGAGSTAVSWNGGAVEVDSASNAVYVYEVHPRAGT